MSTSAAERTWWSRPGLEVAAGHHQVAPPDAERLARDNGTPLFAYDLTRIHEQAEALRDAFAAAGLDGVVRLALKAQREPDVLRFIRERCPWVGVDVCSPGEVGHALANGWPPEEISFTGTNLSDRDLSAVLEAGVHVNVDLLSQLDRYGRHAPGAKVGLRVNPRVGATYTGGDGSKYAGARPTKFGIFEEQLPRALEIAARHGLVVDTVHFHTGDGYLDDGLPAFEETVRRVAAMTRTLIEAGAPIAEVNTGGGLGVPMAPGDSPLDLGRWVSILAAHLGPVAVTVATEPGDFLVKESALLLTEVVTVEEREGITFVGVDSGWNQACEHFVYGDRFEVVACSGPDSPPSREVTVTGHINEGDDTFVEDRLMPEFAEGDIVAVLGAGSYAASMWSDHCMRPKAPALFFTDRI